MSASWLLLLHQIPPNPPYFRAKVLRRLAQIGALPVKNSAYLLPETDDAVEDFQWICQEVVKLGGGAWLFRCQPLAGMSAEQIEQAFRDLRARDYEALISEAGTVRDLILGGSETAEAAYTKLCRRNEEVRRIDFFGCNARTDLEELLSEIGTLRSADSTSKESHGEHRESGKTWVTRKGVRVDRISSAWLIRRFIDPHAEFQFVGSSDYVHREGEICFDMFDGEFTHIGERCTFEVMVEENGLSGNVALVALAEIVHDIDLKDDRYQRPETAGVARLISGICLHVSDDGQRLAQGAIVLDSLYAGLQESSNRPGEEGSILKIS